MVHNPPPGHLPPGMHPGQMGVPQFNNEKLTDSFISELTVGQTGFVNSLNPAGLVPETYTLQFSFVTVEAAASGKPFIPTCKAIITWKVDGQHQRRVISIVSGASISAPCNAVDVKLQDEPLGGDNTIGKKYKVQTTLSRGLRANTQEPPTLLTVPSQGIGTGASAVIPVPQDSGVTQMLLLLASGNTADVFSETSVIVSMRDVAVPSPFLLGTYYPLKCCHWMPLTPGTQEVVVTNGTGVTIFATVIWGIDG